MSSGGHWVVDNTKANTRMSLFKIKLLITRPLIERQIFAKWDRPLVGAIKLWSRQSVWGADGLAETMMAVCSGSLRWLEIEWHLNWQINTTDTRLYDFRKGFNSIFRKQDFFICRKIHTHTSLCVLNCCGGDRRSTRNDRYYKPVVLGGMLTISSNCC